MKNEERKRHIQKIGRAVEALPAHKREYILGYCEGVLAMEDLRNKPIKADES